MRLRWQLSAGLAGLTGLAFVAFVPLRAAWPGDPLLYDLVSLILFGGAALGLGAWLARRISRALNQFNQGIDRVLMGQFGYRIPREQAATFAEIDPVMANFNAMLGTIQQQYDQLEQRVALKSRDLQVAADLTRQVTTTLDLDKLLPKITTLARAGLQLASVSIYLYDPDTDGLTLSAQNIAPEYDSPVNQARLKRNDAAILRSVAEGRMPIWQTHEMHANERLTSPHLHEMQSEIAVPMAVAQELLGVLHLQSDRVDRFDMNDVANMFSFGGQVGVAVKNARAYQEQVHIAEIRQQADMMKSQFLASMSHELRTPLNAILNYTQFVSRGTLGDIAEAQKDALEKSVTSAKHLLSLINDILDISKIAAGKLELFIQPVCINTEAQTALDSAEALLTGKDVQLNVDMADDMPELDGDRRRVRQIFLNLISNAIKFTDEGQITVRTEHTPEQLRFSVADTGAGIPPDDIAAIFESFKQHEAGLMHDEGSGLGLPISKKLAQAHGGDIDVQSTPGEGSTFTVWLPRDGHVSEEIELTPESGAV